jgi:hypothetical protein
MTYSSVSQVFNPTKSLTSLTGIDNIRYDEKGKYKYDSYIFSDPDEGISFKEEYQYKFDSDDYDWGTPRSLYFLEKEREEEFKNYALIQEAQRLRILRTLNSDQQKIYSSLSPMEQYDYLFFLIPAERETCIRLSSKNRSVFLSLDSRREMNTYLSLDQPQKDLFNNLGITRRRDLLSLSQEKKYYFLHSILYIRKYGLDMMRQNGMSFCL